MRFSLTGISAANLTGGPSDNAFDLTGWHGTATLAGGGGVDQITVGPWSAVSCPTRRSRGAARRNFTERHKPPAQLTMVGSGGTTINAGAAFSGDVLFGQGGGNTLTGGTGSDYIVGGDARTRWSATARATTS